MKKLFLLFAFIFLFFSCTKDTENNNYRESVKNSSIELNSCASNPNNYRTRMEKSVAIEQFNSLFTGTNSEKLEQSIIEGMLVFNDLETLGDNISSTTFDAGLINDYLRLVSKEEIDVEKYVNEGTEIIKDENSSVDDFVKYLKSYNVYSEGMIDLFVSFEKEFMESNSDREYDQAFRNLKNAIEKSDLSLFDKNSMKLYSFIMTGVIGTNVFKEDVLRDDCTKCLKKHRKRIFGWGAFWILIAVIACILTLVGGPVAVIACIIGVAGAFILNTIRIYCGHVCSWI